MLKKNNYSKNSSIYSMLTRVFLCMLFSMMAASCAPKVSFKIQRPPLQQVQNIKYIEIGNFEIIPGKIELPGSEKLANSESVAESKKTLQPAVTSFISKKGKSNHMSELVRAALVHDLSLHSPYQLINTTGDKTGYSGVLPNAAEVGVISGKIKFSEMIFESSEKLSYFANIKNKGVRLEQSLLAGAVVMGAEASGRGFLIPTPYVEHLGAIEVEFFILKRKLYEKVDFPQRRVQTFTPANGKPSINKVINNLNKFINESFIDGEYNTEHIYIKNPSKKNCRFCEFNQTEYCDAGVL